MSRTAPRGREGGRRIGLATAAVVLTLASWARADGVDIAWYLSRVPGWHRAPFLAVLLLLGLTAADYLLNLVVIGVPATRMGASTGRVARDLIGFTLLGQVADRFGAVVGPVVGDLLVPLFHVRPGAGLGLTFSIGFVVNFALVGAVVGLMVRWYMRRRWSLSGRRVVVMACIAGIFTNPLWGAFAMQFAPNQDAPPRVERLYTPRP